jgi:hypothetical protein
VQGLSGDEAAVRAGQEHEAGGHLGGLTGSAHGRGELVLSLGVHGGGDEGSPD